MHSSIVAALSALTIAAAIAPQKLTGVFIPPEYTYLLPLPFEGNITKNFIDTETSNASVNAQLAAARNATYIAYDEEFHSILGASPTIQLIEYKNETVPFAEEAGIWVPNHNQVWFTSDGSVLPTYFSILDLATNTITTPNNTAQHGTYPNGGAYFNNLVYFASLGNESLPFPPGIYSIDPSSPSTPPVTILNSYFGVNLNSIDDITWVPPNTSTHSTSCVHTSETNLFFTTLDLNASGETGLSAAVLANAVYRFTPSTKSLQAVISRADVLVPNGIRVSPDGKYIYVTDSSPLSILGAGAGLPSSGSPAIYRFELDADCNPVNKILFAMPRSGAADGIHVDDYGRVWTAEWEGIVVRNSRGKELGVFNAEALLDEKVPIANFALAGDKLIILALNRIFVVQLGQNVTAAATGGL